MSVILEPTQIPPTTPATPPLPATKGQATPTQVPDSEAFIAFIQRVSDLEKYVKELKQVDHTPAILKSIKFEVPKTINKYLGSTLGDTLQKVLQRHTEDLNLQVSHYDVSNFIKVKQEHVAHDKIPKYPTTSYDQVVDDEHKQKEILFQMMMASKSYEKHLTHKDLELNLDNVANDTDEPQADAIQKIPKKDWVKNTAFNYKDTSCKVYIGRAMINRKSKHEVFSTMRILSVVSVKVEKKFGYGDLEEIVVRRADHKLYKFKEGDFPDLHLNDVKDMLPLIAQKKLFNLYGDVIVDFFTALKMFTRGIMVKNKVEDIQLGVESYQRKLTLTKPPRTCQHISFKEPYTSKFDPPGVIYNDKSKKKRLMRIDEIHKFCDGTLQSVHNILHEMLLNFKFGYNKGIHLREWTTKDKRCTGITLNKIDDLLFKR
nr:hypothetical protein [Tanacetum cinerariifolium]